MQVLHPLRCGSVLLSLGSSSIFVSTAGAMAQFLLNSAATKIAAAPKRMRGAQQFSVGFGRMYFLNRHCSRHTRAQDALDLVCVRNRQHSYLFELAGAIV